MVANYCCCKRQYLVENNIWLFVKNIAKLHPGGPHSWGWDVTRALHISQKSSHYLTLLPQINSARFVCKKNKPVLFSQPWEIIELGQRNLLYFLIIYNWLPSVESEFIFILHIVYINIVFELCYDYWSILTFEFYCKSSFCSFINYFVRLWL